MEKPCQINECIVLPDAVTAVRYYDLRRHWTKRIKPHLDNAELNAILVQDFHKFTWGRWRTRFKPGMYPRDVESCDWSMGHRGCEPRFWRFVKHAACHWLVNFALRLACLAEPTRPWRIVTSDLHSTVWDGKNCLFDFNFQALGIPPDECWRAVRQGRQMLPGKFLKLHLAEHYSVDAS